MKPGLRSILALLFVLPSITQAQILKPVKWNIQLSNTSPKAGEEIEVIFRATIDDVWYLYANGFDPDCGPMITEVVIENPRNFELAGDLKSINPVAKHDEIFDCDVKIFKKTGEFRQRIRVLGNPLSIAGTIE